MNQIHARLSLIFVTLLQFATVAFAGPLDEYFLNAYGVSGSKTSLKSTTLTTSTDVPPLEDQNSNGIPDWVETVASTFDDTYTQYTARGYNPPPTSDGYYHVYLRDLSAAGNYGVTTSLGSQSTSYPYGIGSFIEIDKDFKAAIYARYLPLESLKITAAHEFNHAIQYGYNFYFDIWYAEATATWFEDELFDSVNQLYTYIPAWLKYSTLRLDVPVSSNATTIGAGYGRWLFNRFLAEKYSTHSIRNFWEKVAISDPPCTTSNGVKSCSDLAMVPILDSVLASSYGTSLSSDFIEFIQRIYVRDWQSHTNEIGLIPQYSNHVTQNTYTTFPISAIPVSNYNGYSFSIYTMKPSVTAPANVTISINADNGITAVLYRKDNGTPTLVGKIDAFPANISVNNFTSTSEVALLIINATNTDGLKASFSTDGSSIPLAKTALSSPTNLSLLTVSTETAQISTALQHALKREWGLLQPETQKILSKHLAAPVLSGEATYTSPQRRFVIHYATSATQSSSANVSNGCFIATAAYGSYLHPQVRLLRNFRDEYLLTNAPGRVFVDLYYRSSPPIADFIARHPFLRGVTRLALTPIFLVITHPYASGSALLGAVTLLSLSRRRRSLRLLTVG